MRAAVVRFPGSNCDHDTLWVLERVLGWEAFPVWHRSQELGGAELVVLPGGFSFGDYLRAGAIAARSPVLEAVRRHAAGGGLVLGICNGFQILCEAGLLPGTLRPNKDLRFHCHTAHIRVERIETPFTAAAAPGQLLELPVAHFEGAYHVSPGELERMEDRGQVVFRYVDALGRPVPEANFNGSVGNVAGICSEDGRILGMMPHPERASEPLMGGSDGLWIWRSLERRILSTTTA
ncbi:phosphoribosylformylglycinamidine synthase subunit PurQ [Limnochorda pilosa]|uniref:Phosphoribosylformylglycinamidine synthase subunit PurQ n=1 Tax=Limnochorda pilosa TaxID=1555112 RepID=A0A0K2SJZ3_LIMPI|nr:phosphoribosylformylglycinamidine synthase subunit PurQ [Limnochorda pilosa]BAS27420.1 phosphoribosylformylglycinamidine synthase [Limnochorda pilosa]